MSLGEASAKPDLPPATAESATTGTPPPAREYGLDALRGFLMLCVVFGHFPSRSLAEANASSLVSNLTLAVYLFHVPAFFLLSGLFVRPAKSVVRALWDQRVIFCVFILWGLAFNRAILWPLDPAAFARFIFLANWPAIHSPMWFLPCLIGLRLLVSLWLSSPTWLRTVLLAISLIVILQQDHIAAAHTEIPYGLDIAFYLLPAIILARHVIRTPFLDSIPQIASAAAFIVCIALLWVLEPLKTYNGFTSKIDLAQFSTTDTPLNYSILVVGLLALIATFKKMTRPRLSGRAMIMLGIYSMPVFILSMGIMKRWVSQIPSPSSLPLGLAYVSCGVLLGGFGPILLSKALERVLPRRVAEYMGLAASISQPPRLLSVIRPKA